MPSNLVLIIVSLFVQPSPASEQTCSRRGHKTCNGHDDAAAGLVVEEEEMPMSALQKQMDIDTNTDNGSWGRWFYPPGPPPPPTASSCSSLRSLDRDLASIASAVYEADLDSISAHVSGWELHRPSAASISQGSGTDHIRIYQQHGCADGASSRYCTRSMRAGRCNSGNRLINCRMTCRHCVPTCAVAFSGSDDWADWLNNFRFDTVSMCGAPGVHRGFVAEASNILTSPEWRPIASFLAASCGTTYAVGHSLGGAIATILTYCAGQNALGQYGATFSVDGLYTYGAPAVSAPALTNTSGSCFAGNRFYTMDSLSYDPVPYLATVPGYLHPKLEAQMIAVDAQYVVSSTSSSCSASASTRLPAGSIGFRAPQPSDHDRSTYIARAELLSSCSN